MKEGLERFICVRNPILPHPYQRFFCAFLS